MNSTIAGTTRRFVLTLTVAGIAALGSVAVAPAASAAPADGPNYLVEGNGTGPDAFVVTSTGRVPVFFCEDVQPGKDGVVDPRDMARAAKQAADEVRKAAHDAERDAKKAAEVADKAARDADRAASRTDLSASQAAEEAAKDARDALKDAQEAVDRVMKQHNICLTLSPGAPRF